MNKSIFKSKTFYYGLFTAIAPAIPSLQSFLAENMAAIGVLWGALGIALRWVTKDKVVLID